MKFLILIDRIYSKIMIFFLLLVIPFTAFSVYLYLNLPNIIPVQFGLRFEPSNWGNKATILFPLIFLILPTFMSRKSISSQEKLLTRSASAEIITIVLLTFLLIMMIGVYYLYFKML